MEIPRLTCTGCGYRTLNPWRYGHHRQTCAAYARFWDDMMALSAEYEHYNPWTPEQEEEYRQRDKALVERYRRQWSANKQQ